MSARLALPSRRNYVTQKIRIADQRTFYICLQDGSSPAEIVLRVKVTDCTSETIALYDVIAHLMSVVLQYAVSLEKLGDLLTSSKFGPCGPVSGHDRLKHCSSLLDLIGRHLLVEYCGRNELAHMPRALAEVSDIQEAQS